MTTTLAFLGTLGGQEMMLIFLITLLLFGSKKLPELARGVGKSMGEFKRAREEFEREIHQAAYKELEEKKDSADHKKDS